MGHWRKEVHEWWLLRFYGFADADSDCACSWLLWHTHIITFYVPVCAGTDIHDSLLMNCTGLRVDARLFDMHITEFSFSTDSRNKHWSSQSWCAWPWKQSVYSECLTQLLTIRSHPFMFLKIFPWLASSGILQKLWLTILHMVIWFSGHQHTDMFSNISSWIKISPFLFSIRPGMWV